MKKIKLLAVVIMMTMLAVNASAQFTNSGSSSNTTGENWEGLRVAYSPMSLDFDGGGDVSFTGLSVGYVYGVAISKSAPIYVEFGASLLWTTKDLTEDLGYDKEDDLTVKHNMISINVPVNFGYKFDFNNNISLYPYVGVNLRGNIIGKWKFEGYGESEEINIFDEDDMGEDLVCKSFQVGWQIGTAVNFNKFTVYASYGQDFSEFMKNTKVHTTTIGIGFNF